MLARLVFTHSRYLALIFISVIAVGITSFQSIARQEDPSLSNFVATVTTFFPGATPARVEALVTRPLEDALREIAEIDELNSTSSAGVSFINVMLLDTLPDETLERVWSEVRDALDDAATEFPAEAGAPVFDNDRLTSFTTITSLSSNGDEDMPLSLLNRLAQDFADVARNLPATDLVVVIGEPVEEVRVAVDELGLVSRGLSLAQVSEALRAADVKMPSGRATGGGTDLLVELAGDLDSLNRIRDVIVHTSNGAATRIGDIARVYKTAASPAPAMALSNGRRSILVGTVMQDGNQVDVWSERFRDMVAAYQAQSPRGLALEVTYDQSSYAEKRLREVATNLCIGVALVILVLLFTLGWRAALVVAIILPLCGLVSLTVMDRMGMALHQMSISGLIVALGLLVDGSIVMTDEVRKRLLRGESALQSITGSVDRLRVPLIASAVTTVLAFMPMAILPGPAGDFVGSIAKAVIIMLTASTALALIITPVLAAWLLPRKEAPAGQWYTGGVRSGRAGTALAGAMDWSLRHPLAAITLALSLPVTGFLAFPTLTAQFFPGTDRDQLYLQVKLADGRSIEDTAQLVERIDEELRAHPQIRRVDWSIGESAPAFYYNMYRFKERLPSWAEALVLTVDEDITDELIRQLQTSLDRDYPAAQIIVRGIDQGPPVMAPLEIKITGPELDTLQALGEQFRQRFEAIPQITHTSADLIGGAPKLRVALDEDRLRLAGLQLSDVAVALNDSLQGRVGGEVLEGTERLPVRVRLDEAQWGAADSIANIHIPLPSQTLAPSSASTSGRAPVDSDTAGNGITAVPLDVLGAPALTPSRSPISRLDGRRVNTVKGYLVRGVLPEEALKLLQQDLQAHPIPMPDGYSLSYGGSTDERAGVVDKIMAPMGLIAAALMATIVLTFNSWRLSAIALLVCVCSLGLSLFSLEVFRYPFGIQALIGVIGSIGVSINAAIIIITALQANAGAARGELLPIRNVVMDSSRHIISTTVTTFGGFLPLILEGSEFWPPFAMAIAGGVLLSTIISFFLVPPMFLLAVRLGGSSLAAGAVNPGTDEKPLPTQVKEPAWSPDHAA
ncbi:MAG: efflux RND transporter permease subunit [Halioglobus sp.]